MASVLCSNTNRKMDNYFTFLIYGQITTKLYLYIFI